MTMGFARVVIALCAIALFMPAPRAAAWHDAGHMAIALIAYRELGPERAAAFVDILRKHPDYGLWMSAKPSSVREDVFLFMRAATWPDEIKSTSHPSKEHDRPSWHYAWDFHAHPIDMRRPRPESGLHIQEAMKVNEEALKSGDVAAKSRALCWIFHLVGDAQQPLHTGSLLTRDFPQGDRGGNRFFVRTATGPTNLHAFWDGFWNDETRPDGASASSREVDYSKVDSLSRVVARKHPRTSLPELERNATLDSWIQESGGQAKTHAYRWEGLIAGRFSGGTSAETAVPLPPGYQLRARALADRKLAIGGYRLADVLKKHLRFLHPVDNP